MSKRRLFAITAAFFVTAAAFAATAASSGAAGVSIWNIIGSSITSGETISDVVSQVSELQAEPDVKDMNSATPFASLNIPNSSPVVIDFAGYTGAGFQSVPTAGQLDSDDWAVTGWSDGALVFGGTATTGDYARGSTAAAVSTGGFYAYTGSPHSVANPAFMIQPGGSDFAPGTLTLRLQNTGATNIQQLAISYNLFIRNDQDRANSFNFSHSDDNTTYTAEASLNYTSPQALDAAGWVKWEALPAGQLH